MLDVKVIRKRQTNYPAVFDAINKRFLPEAGVIVLNATQRNIREKKIIDTGRLRASYHFRVTRKDVSVGTNLNYAPYQEYGTRFQPARPHLRPALDKNRKLLVARWAQIYNKVFKLLGGK